MSYNIAKFIKESEKLALDLGHSYLTIDHISVVSFGIPSIVKMFESIHLDAARMKERMLSYMNSTNIPPVPSLVNLPTEIAQSSMVNVLITDLSKKSVIEQLKANDHTIDAFFILFECLSFPNTVLESVLNEYELTRSDIATQLQKYIDNQNYEVDLSNSTIDDSTEQQTTRSTTTSSKKNSIENYTTNLTERAKQGKIDPLIGRTNELKDLIQILSRKNKKCGIMVGDPGVGKTQIIDGLALLIQSGEVPDALKDIEILVLEIASLMAGTKYRGDLEERVDNIIKELKQRPNTILFIDEIHTLMNSGNSSGGLDISNMLKPALSKGEIRVIGATTYDEYRRYFEKDAALSRRFMKVDIVEPTIAETREILKGIQPYYEKFHGVKYTKESVDTMIELANQYIKNKRFPDKAIDLMDASGARVKNAVIGKVQKSDVEFEVSQIVNLPLEIIACKESTRMTELSSNLHKRVFGQDGAIEQLVDNVMVARAGLRDQNSIQGAFMFVGESGTGKTEISKALADSLGVELIRFDMSEYAQEHNVSKLIGSPPGYVGHDSGNGALLDKIEQHPNCILLLDEIEKANNKVLLTFLQVMDEGRLTGSHGKTVHFNNVTIIMTTNIGARNAKVRSLGASNSGKDGIDVAIKERFAPEFINRLDAIVKFVELDKTTIMSIVDKFISIINDGLKSRKVKVQLDKKAKEWLVENGTEDGMGARPMKRCINTNIKKVLAREILCGSLVDGGKAKFTVQDNKLVLIDATETTDSEE